MSVIVYRYDLSPYSRKLHHTILLKNIPQTWVNVPMIPPRPDVELLGVGHRRIPILAIGGDLYFDTSLAASALERRFPPGQYGSIFPPRKHNGGSDAALIKLFAKSWVDDTLSPSIVSLLRWHLLPSQLVHDRESLFGRPIDIEKQRAARPANLSVLSSHITFLEEQLADGREWLFDTESPSFADSAAHASCLFARTLLESESIFTAETFPQTTAWLARLSDHLAILEKAQPVTYTSGEEAAAQIASAPREPETVVGFNKVEAGRLGFKLRDTISVVCDDGPGNIPTIGVLVALNREEIVLETQSALATFRCHFPRIAYTATLV
ncbi:Glutathione S-transferase [Mycena indigotica]|uniref:Glutathione S-transferase n=1 Tax=Mycena indigotica TaxID=2126181 RepID=A0A8H6SI53_9AGAR|nr:Glutathione S-transferase [Mycena indigotica]KAF7299287.1 Glutathione S-transferase [Mycena indigotica]